MIQKQLDHQRAGGLVGEVGNERPRAVREDFSDWCRQTTSRFQAVPPDQCDPVSETITNQIGESLVYLRRDDSLRMNSSWPIGT